MSTFAISFQRRRRDGERAYLVLEVDWRIEVRDLGVDGFAEHFVLDVVHEFAHF